MTGHTLNLTPSHGRKRPRRAVVTIAIGQAVAPLAARTVPLMSRYAGRIGADFVVIDTPRFSEPGATAASVVWEKFQLHDVLGRFDEVLYLDADVLVRPDCPDLLAFCGGRFGAFDEAPYHPPTLERVGAYCRRVGLPVVAAEAYYNSGVLVLTAAHRAVFDPPDEVLRDGDRWLSEQTLITVRVRQLGLAVRHLPQAFNAMPYWLRAPGYERSCPVVHLAACGSQREVVADRLLSYWRAEGIGL